MRSKEFLFSEIISAPEFYASVIISLLAGALLYLQQKSKALFDIEPLTPVFILFIAVFIFGLFSPIAVVLINIIVFAIGIFTIKDGAKQDNLGILNFGLLVITALVISRYFDKDLSFVIRGLLFLGVGIGFFAANYWLLKKRKTNE